MKKVFKILSFVLALVMCFSSITLSAYAANEKENTYYELHPESYEDIYDPLQPYWFIEKEAWWRLQIYYLDYFIDSTPQTYYEESTKTFYLLGNGGHCWYTDGFNGYYDNEWIPDSAPQEVEHIIVGKGVNGIQIGFNDLPELQDVIFMGDLEGCYLAFNNCPKLEMFYHSGGIGEGVYNSGLSQSFNNVSPNGLLFLSKYTDQIKRRSPNVTYKKITADVPEIGYFKTENTKTGVKITWDASVDIGKHTVVRYDEKQSKSSKKVIGTTHLGEIVDETVKNGKTYTYCIDVDGMEPQKITRLTQPVITSCVSTASNKVTVKWNKVEGAKGYYIYRSTTGKKGSWTKIANLKSDKLSYTASGLKLDTKYYICVKAYSGKSVSIGTTKTVNVGVPEITSVKKDGNYINLKWRKQSDAVYYKVYTRVPGNDEYTTAATIKDPNKTSCKVKVASENGTAIKVRAFYKSGKKTVYATTPVCKVGY